jgi:hypothetical protein
VRIVDRDLGAVLAIAIDEAGVIAATARGELVAVRYDGTPRWTRAVHAGWAWALAAVAGGIASCGDDGRVVVADARGATRVIAELGVPCRALAALPSSALIAGDTTGAVHAITAAPVARWRAHAAAITSLVALGDGTFASSSEDGRVMRWTGERGELAAASDDFVTSLAVDPAGLVCAGYDGAIRRI